jgi:hypothetical protein
MTEAEWLAPGDLRKHVALMWSKRRARKLRLLGVACCRPLEPWMYDPVMAKALLRAELTADGELNASTADVVPTRRSRGGTSPELTGREQYQCLCPTSVGRLVCALR